MGTQRDPLELLLTSLYPGQSTSWDGLHSDRQTRDDVTAYVMDVVTARTQPNMANVTSEDHMEVNSVWESTWGCAVYDFIISGVVVGVSCFLGLLGNAASFHILRQTGRRSVTTFLLTVLALADSFFLLPAILLFVLPGFCNFPPKRPWCGDTLRAALPFIDQYGWAVASMAHTFTIYVTMLVTWHRYKCVCRPHEAPRSSTLSIAKKQVLIVGVFAILYNIPRFLEFNVKVTVERLNAGGSIGMQGNRTHLSNGSHSIFQSDGNESFTTPWPEDFHACQTRVVTVRTLTELGRNSWYQIVYKNMCFYILIYIIPLITLSILTTRLAQLLKKRRHFRFRLSIRTRQSREDSTTLVLIVVVVAFLICQTPTLFQRLFYTIFRDEGQKCPHFFFYFERFADYCAILNSCINFIIYVMFSRRFRQVLWSSLRRKPIVKRAMASDNSREKHGVGGISSF